jgi:diguanylate cyclase (GGDEF)-like protein
MNRIRAVTREMDLLAQYGRGSFAVMTPGMAGRDALELAERIRKNLLSLNRTTVASQTVSFTVNVGVADVRSATDPQRILEASEIALTQTRRSEARETCPKDSDHASARRR